MNAAHLLVEGVFVFFAAVLAISALGVVVVRNPVHAALFLILAFFNAAVLWVLMGAEFLGIVLVLVYVGAVMVLLLFVVMMLDIDLTVIRRGFVRHAPLAAAVAVLLVFEIGYVFWARRLGLVSLAPHAHAPAVPNTRALGLRLYRDDLYPFEIAGFLLLVGVVAAIVLTLEHRRGVRRQDPSAQVRVEARGRIRLVDPSSSTSSTHERGGMS
jgi:NADH-quinone oxidoreductase subunit J